MKTVYILVEGEPNSPELPFLQNLISEIISSHHKPYDVQLFEVGGCSALANGNVAKTFYKLSKSSGNAHKTIPALAIADSDYKIALSKEQKSSNTDLIKSQKAKIIYWKRHEWENYLLDETQLIADFVNDFPIKRIKTYHKKVDASVQKEDLDDFLLKYFIEKRREEFKACLKFNIRHFVGIDESYRSISFPENSDFESMRNWFFDYNKEKKYPLISSPDLPCVWGAILDQYRWDKWLPLNESSNKEDKRYFIQFAMKNFRGKEAFSALVNFLIGKGFYISLKNFTIDLLEGITEKGNNSAIYKDLESIILAELP